MSGSSGQCWGWMRRWLDELGKLNLRWCDGWLLCSAGAQGRESLMDDVRASYAFIMQFVKATESRWVTIGKASRALLGALTVGLDHLVHAARQRPRHSNYYLAGYDRLTPDLRLLVSIASLASHVPDGVLHELLEDDRLAARTTHLEDTIVSELHTLIFLPDFVWHRMAHQLDPEINHTNLRTMVLQAANTAAAFVDHKILRHLRALPWSLLRGDVSSNLLDLLEAADPPEEPLASKIWQLGQMGPWN